MSPRRDYGGLRARYLGSRPPVPTSGAREGSRRLSVAEDHPDRTWRPEEKASDQAMNVVLELLMAEGHMSQDSLSRSTADALGVALGTGRAYTSASLLHFREAGWVRCVNPGERALVWELID